MTTRNLQLNADQDCFTKAKAKGEQTFTLRAQDRSSPQTIVFWIMQNIETCPPTKLFDALQDAINMRNYKERKNAD